MKRSIILFAAMAAMIASASAQQTYRWGLSASLTDDRSFGLVYKISPGSRIGLALSVDVLNDTAAVRHSDFFVQTGYQQLLGAWDRVGLHAGAGVGFGGGTDAAGISFGRMRIHGQLAGEYNFSDAFSWFGALQLNYERKSFPAANEMHIYSNANTGFTWWFR